MLPSNSKNDGYQILNVSNMNSMEDITLNDESLLALIQQYPFLYNPHVRPHNDRDYDEWAWEQIAKVFNRSYEESKRTWTVYELKSRWKVLQPIVRSLSKINNIQSLPDTLRQTVVKISVPMDESTNEPLKKPLTQAQKTLFDYEELVKSLPLVERRRLEAEMMELILNSELESKATIKLGASELQAIEKDYNDVLRAIGMIDIYYEDEKSLESEKAISAPQTNQTKIEIIDNGPKIIIASNKQDVQKYDGNENLSNGNISISNNQNATSVEETEENLLEPLERKRWVPLTQWRGYVRKCRVRVKRIIMEDDLPLAVIKREKL